jgi:GntR family transcriptional regulator
MINKEPIYQQLNHLLKELIQDEGYEIGDKFLTERAICDTYDVSRATANKAISNLVSEGILEFRKGVGTFIKAHPSDEPPESIASFTENVSRAGKTPGSRVLTFERVKASEIDEKIRQALQIEEKEELFRVERLRLADETPMMLEERFIVAGYCPDLSKHSMEGSLYSLLNREYGIRLTGSDETIQAIVIGKREAELLDVEEGLAGFRVTSIGYINEGIPLWWEQTTYRPAGIEFRCQIRPHRTDINLRERLLLSSQEPEKSS